MSGILPGLSLDWVSFRDDPHSYSHLDTYRTSG